jgi:hypothetical protein
MGKFLGITASAAALLGFTTAWSAVPTSLGWYQLPDSKMQSVCPSNGFNGYDYKFADNCGSVTEAWGSAAFDDTRNRLVIWGGGHSDYSGNEIYTLDVNDLKFKRLTDPAPPPPANDCPEALANGAQPNSRHTYDGITYMKNSDRLFAIGGSKATCGYMSGSTWTFDFKAMKWQQMNPTGSEVAHDPNTGVVFVHDGTSFYSYDFAKNAYTTLIKDAPIDYHLTGTIDTKRQKMVMIGHGEQWVIDISGKGYKMEKLGSTGGSTVIDGTSPGLTYDPSEDRILSWDGGNSVFALNMDTKAWAQVTYPNGPGAAIENGTNGRWAYVPSLNGFLVVNEAKNNAYTFKWSAKAVGLSPAAKAPKAERGAVLRFPGEVLQPRNDVILPYSDRDVAGRAFPLPRSGGSLPIVNSVHVIGR